MAERVANELSDAELHETVIASQAEIDRLCAQQAQLLAAWDARGVWSGDGSRSSASRLARETGLSESDAKCLVNRARHVHSMPLSFASWVSGVLSSSRFDLLVRANSSDRCDLFGSDESVLIDRVSSLSYNDAKKVVQYWIQCVDDVGSESRSRRLLEQRSAQISRTFEGSVDLRALFDPVSGEQFIAEMERLEQHLFESDWAEAHSQLQAQFPGYEINSGDLVRSPAQRRCDALVLMAKRSASFVASRNGSGKDGDADHNTVGLGKATRALISVVVDYSTFGRICEMSSGHVISPGQVIPLLGNADIERIVFDGPSRVVKDLGHKRFFRGALRRAIEIRDQHCQHESGCSVPASKCDVDHSTAHIRGGPTSQANGQLLCPFHNRWKGAGPP